MSGNINISSNVPSLLLIMTTAACWSKLDTTPTVSDNELSILNTTSMLSTGKGDAKLCEDTTVKSSTKQMANILFIDLCLGLIITSLQFQHLL